MTYMNAEMELVSFAAEDVLATSNDPIVATTSCGGAEDLRLPEDELE